MQKTDNSLRTMGDNTYGQLGTGNNTNSNIPVQVLNPSSINFMDAGSWHTLIYRTSNAVGAVGYNIAGQLRDGTTTNRSAFVDVPIP